MGVSADQKRRRGGRVLPVALALAALALGVTVVAMRPSDHLDCYEVDGLQRDECLRTQAEGLGAGSFQEASNRIMEIRDPVVRATAVRRWLARNGPELRQDQVVSLCRQVGGPSEAEACARKQLAVHLRDLRIEAAALPEAEPARVLPSEDCAAYEAEPDSWATCRRRAAARVDSAEEMVAICDGLAAAAGPCRTSWLRPRVDEAGPDTIDSLLDLCLGEDCRFELLDRYSDRLQPLDEAQLRAELVACVDHLDRFRRDCVEHAAQRWSIDGADPSSVDVLVELSGPDADVVATWVGLAQECRHVGSCDALASDLVPACQDAIEAVRSGQRGCPPDSKPPLVPHRGPRGPGRRAPGR